MILTMVTEEQEGTNGISAFALARRRANAGRNVLLVSQNTSRKKANQYKKSATDVTWLLKEMKAGAKTYPLLAEAFANELLQSSRHFHDIVIDLPMPSYSEAGVALNSSNLLVFAIPMATWSDDRHSRLLRCVKTARKSNPALPVLLMLDEIASVRGQNLIGRLARIIPNIQFMQIVRSDDMSTMNLYRAIYSQ